jgi:hypothetical protein
MSKNTGNSRWIWGVFLVAPLVLGAKGCDAVVGNDPAPKACGGLTGAACARGQFCDFTPEAQCGAADATGLCRPIPEGCTDIYQPVCGCDDQTHGNACSANMAGVSVASDGECSPGGGGGTCGGLLGLQCEAGEFCKFASDAMCGAGDQTGTCAPIPDACDSIFDPVCGCDGQTYGNACEANRAGISVESDGECGGGGQTDCGGLLGLECEADEFCDFLPDAMCGRADATGTCFARPEVCPTVDAPVCGCDGQTYSNVCEANMFGVSVESDGECGGGGGEACGGLTGLPCETGEFCNFPLDAICGTADATGTCTPTPRSCTEEYVPVCGCDGMTYDNACSANSAGFSVASEGPCP